MKKNLLLIVSIFSLTLLFTACEDFGRELSDVENTSLPDRDKIFANPDDYPSVIQGLWGDWHWAQNCFDCDIHASVAGQGISSSWGNFGMRESGTIPRIPFVNDESHPAIARATGPWYNNNAVIANANEILKLIIDPDNPKVIMADGGDITQMVLANAYALAGMSLGAIATQFDQGYAATDITDPVALVLEPASAVRDASIYMLDKAIAISNGNSFSMPASYVNGLTLSNTDFAKILQSTKARILATHARSAAENSATDWAAVLGAANSGITEDFAPEGDGWTRWADAKRRYLTNAGWARVSQRVIADMADPSEAVTGGAAEFPWPEGVDILAPLDEALPGFDNRVKTDFTYDGESPYPASRGYYFFGSYTNSRYAVYGTNGFVGPMNFLNVAENDLYKAEALVRTGGSKADAAGLINNTRVTRGGLAALTGSESDQVLIDAIMYERNAELMMTWGVLIFADRRRTDSLEPGTYPQMPVPARELNVLGLPIYSFP